MKSIAVLFAHASISALCATSATAQQSESERVRMPNQSMYVELKGNAGFVSLNYDRKLNESFTVRVGYGMWSSLSFLGDQPQDQARFVPVMLNYVWRNGATTPHWFEIGAGIVRGRRWRDFEPHKHLLALAGTIGYRLTYDHALVRLGFAPIHPIHGDFPGPRGMRPAASVGFSF